MYAVTQFTLCLLAMLAPGAAVPGGTDFAVVPANQASVSAAADQVLEHPRQMAQFVSRDVVCAFDAPSVAAAAATMAAALATRANNAVPVNDLTPVARAAPFVLQQVMPTAQVGRRQAADALPAARNGPLDVAMVLTDPLPVSIV